ALEVPASDHVREGVVVNGLVVFIRADHPIDVRTTVAVVACAGHPVAGGLDEEWPPGLFRQGGVASPVDVARRRPGDVGDDVLLELSRPDANELAGCEPCRGRRDIDTYTRVLI